MNSRLAAVWVGGLALLSVARTPAANSFATNESSTTLHLTNGVRVVINRPAPPTARPLLLVLYALPNGNTIEQTTGRQVSQPENWRDGIQHIAAQTRFVREVLTNREVAVAYLENSLKSWPAWRKTNGDPAIPPIIDRVLGAFPGRDPEIALNGHSGGGSFIFGYINTQTNIPGRVTRIAFLDSDYAYSAALGHDRKLSQWLNASPRHHLMVLAYDDANALLEGKPFVSAAGGTWGRTHAMLTDLARQYPFRTNAAPPLTSYVALEGRVLLLLRENPERKIYHTLQVEQNGFIHSLLSGTPHEGQGYTYLGPRAYDRWVEP